MVINTKSQWMGGSVRNRKSLKKSENIILMVWDQRVAGSNPATPTKEKAFLRKQGFFF
jgi:hypothetical protein